ncbi:cold shock domain-containing protein [Candidatus Poriferisocius sp.]|uniref:cold shock domain-containing protein n=1 Tax=Candidatus Poriferisocius sp. TaxID=3101276 RepID=UPI003B02CA43
MADTLLLTGCVESFDSATGWGMITTVSNTSYPFHCTAVADGTRTIEAGTAVVFRLSPGHRGAWEAVGVTPR